MYKGKVDVLAIIIILSFDYLALSSFLGQKVLFSH
nr:MAG TPA: hypothetical protein [Caudoviricetes sp.]